MRNTKRFIVLTSKGDIREIASLKIKSKHFSKSSVLLLISNIRLCSFQIHSFDKAWLQKTNHSFRLGGGTCKVVTFVTNSIIRCYKCIELLIQTYCFRVNNKIHSLMNRIYHILLIFQILLS